MARRPANPESDRVLLLDMLSASRAVVSFVQGRTWDDYQHDLLLRSAVERQVEIVGEAARRVSMELREAHPDIPWRSIMAQRHRLAHEYGAINDSIIWQVAIEHLPRLIRQLESLTVERMGP